MTITPVVIEDSSPRDLLNRQLFVEQLLSITDTLSKTRKNACYAITGDWGSGKSFVLDMFESKASQIGQEASTLDKYLIFRYNCWEYDYYDEPLIAIVASILDQINKKEDLMRSDFKTKVVTTLKEVGIGLAKISAYAIKEKTGFDPSMIPDVVDNVSSEVKSEIGDKHDYDQYFSFKKYLKKLQEEIIKLTEYQTVIFVVDELDRCLPEYTIKVLERLHHLFNGLPNVQTILSLDMNQLEHTVYQIYGEETNAKRYLRKFIDFEARLDLGTIDDSFYGRFEDYFRNFEIRQSITDIQEVNWFCSLIMEGLDMRSRFAIIERCELLHSMAYEEENADYCYMCLELLLVILKNHTPIDVRFAKEQFDISRIFESGKITPIEYIVPQGLKKLSNEYSKNIVPNHNGWLFKKDYLGNEPYTRVNSRSLLGRLLCAYRVILGFTEDHYDIEDNKGASPYHSIEAFTEYGEKLWKIMEIIR